MPFKFNSKTFVAEIEREKIETFAQLAKLIKQSCVGQGHVEIFIAASIPNSSSACFLSEDMNASNIIDPKNYATIFKFNASKYIFDRSITREKIFVLASHDVQFDNVATAKVLIRNLIAFVLTSRHGLHPVPKTPSLV